MNAKLIEIRDRGTFVPALAVRLCSEVEQEQWLLRRAGWSDEAARGEANGAETGVMLYPLTGNRAFCEPFGWGGRTYPIVHQHLIVNWNDIKPGDVIDVEFILGEVSTPKQSEKVTHG